MMLCNRCTERDVRQSAKKIHYKSPSLYFLGHVPTHKEVALQPSKEVYIAELEQVMKKNLEANYLKTPNLFFQFSAIAGGNVDRHIVLSALNKMVNQELLSDKGGCYRQKFDHIGLSGTRFPFTMVYP